MTKLEVLSMYLPYGVKVKWFDYVSDQTPLRSVEMTLVISDYDFLINQKKGKPILYPLDLTLPIQYEGKEIVPINELNKHEIGSGLFCLSGLMEQHAIYDYNESNLLTYLEGSPVDSYPYDVIQQLLKWRINLWLPENEFINVNSLDVNPYKL